MESLWTPWRMPYIQENKSRRDCLFCELLTAADGRRHILYEGRDAFLILNRYPYTAGHIMAIPYRHVASFQPLRPAELEELLGLAVRGERALVRAYGCHVVHGGVNVGRCAGAGVEGHVHIHLVPRRPGDVARSRRESGRRDPPEPLDVTYRRLKAALEQDDSAS
ncbi:MAG: HIT domain-containing protein [Candidatus Eisenbacteria bacterium]|nr:HIT domain-containing protein [Candidatus Eisenbacteria bacterium]